MVNKFENGEKKQLLTPVTPVVHKKLKQIAQRTGNSMASIIRTAIDEYLVRNTPTTLISDK